MFAAYGVSTDTIRRAIRTGALAAKRDGRGYLLHVDALDAWFHTHLLDIPALEQMRDYLARWLSDG